MREGGERVWDRERESESGMGERDKGGGTGVMEKWYDNSETEHNKERKRERKEETERKTDRETERWRLLVTDIQKESESVGEKEKGKIGDNNR